MLQTAAWALSAEWTTEPMLLVSIAHLSTSCSIEACACLSTIGCLNLPYPCDGLVDEAATEGQSGAGAMATLCGPTCQHHL